jgi:predicted AAA+ superfamily ATPase
MKLFPRLTYLETIHTHFRIHPIVAILGPRQCGKTTLARMYRDTQIKTTELNYFDLEDATDLKRLSDPKLALERLKGLIVIDEIQRCPNLFPALRVLADQQNSERQFLILGSASRELIRQSSETLAGRISYIELPPFSYPEVDDLDCLWLRGGYPRSYLAQTTSDSFFWRESYISTFLEQDIPSLGIQIPSIELRRFWSMIAHYHGNLFNASEFGRSFGKADTTVRRYLDVLSGTFMLRQLQPWQENLKKRQIKAPKVYFRDSGLLHNLLRIETEDDLFRHPKLGASWEGFALEAIIRGHQTQAHDCFFWASHGGAELDLLLFEGNKRIGFEFKHTSAPSLSKSMQISMEDLQLDQLTVIYPGNKTYPLAEKINACGLKTYLDNL